MIFSLLRRLDYPLLLILLALFGVGLTTLYAAVYHGDFAIWYKQLVFWSVGLLAFSFVCFIPLRVLGLLAWPTYLVSVLCLALVPVIGDVHMGARRWLDLGVVNFQPSELMKWSLILMLSFWFATREAVQWQNVFMAVVLAGIPAGLIAIQPDLGTTLVLLMAAAALVVAAGFQWRWLLAAFGASPVVLFGLWQTMHDYQKQRVLTFIDPQSDPLGSGYHVIQSSIAIGSGGLFGKGFLQGTQGRLHFLPEQHTDFIFAILAEEGGLIAISILLLLYWALLWRILVIASQASSRFSGLLCIGIASIFMLYIFVNIGMVSGLLPVVGVPLPFVSYGGSALLTMIVALGIVMRVAIESRDHLPWQRHGSPLA